jgi:hypothetical protein
MLGQEAGEAIAGPDTIAKIMAMRILPLPAIKRLFRDPDLTDQISHRQTQLSLLQHRHDLLHRKPLFLHRRTSSKRKIRRNN